jgi:predicted RNase H-like nuclease
VTWVAGVDGCKRGWLVVLRDTATGRTQHFVKNTFSEVICIAEQAVVIAVDIPIGLLDSAEKGGRECDRQARKLLGSPRRNSVFSPPVRRALDENTFAAALSVNRKSSPHGIGISKQCYAIFKKISEVDHILRQAPALQRKVKEVHPELCFFALDGERAMQHGKKSEEGNRNRRRLLGREGFEEAIAEVSLKHRREDVARDDILDACAACWTAMRIQDGKSIRIPEAKQSDHQGLMMEMWQ